MGNYTFYRMDLYVRSAFALSIALLTLLGVGYLAWKHGRTYCNTICPVGTFLGLISRFSWWKIRIDPAKCTRCGVCATRCKASCIDSRNHRIDYSRCVDCFDCLDACRQDALSFSGPKKAPALPAAEAPAKAAPKDPSRREFLATTLAATLTVPALMAQGHGQQERRRLRDGSGHTRQVPISPPGSLGHEHLGQHCTACHLCISKCPSRVLKPALLEYGLSGMMQPMMYFDKGFCNYDCTVCSDVCPNGAILPLSIEEKHRTQVAGGLRRGFLHRPYRRHQLRGLLRALPHTGGEHDPLPRRTDHTPYRPTDLRRLRRLRIRLPAYPAQSHLRRRRSGTPGSAPVRRYRHPRGRDRRLRILTGKRRKEE